MLKKGKLYYKWHIQPKGYDESAFNAQAGEYLIRRDDYDLYPHGGYIIRDAESGINFVAHNHDDAVRLARYLDRRRADPLDEIGCHAEAFSLRGDWIEVNGEMEFHLNPQSGDVMMISGHTDIRKRIASEIRYYKKYQRTPWARGWHHIITTICTI